MSGITRHCDNRHKSESLRNKLKIGRLLMCMNAEADDRSRTTHLWLWPGPLASKNSSQSIRIGDDQSCAVHFNQTFPLEVREQSGDGLSGCADHFADFFMC